MQALKITIISILSFAAVFSCFSLVLYYGEWERLFMVALFGVFFGAVAAPELELRVFKYPVMQQSIAGFIAGIMLGLSFDLSIEFLLVFGTAGLIVGGTANIWAKHVPIP